MKKKVGDMAKKRDSLNGDHSFKNWFKIMWKNFYIQIFVVALTGLILELVNFDWVIECVRDAASMDGGFFGFLTAFALSLPVWMILVTVWLGFIKFWKDLKNGRSS